MSKQYGSIYENCSICNKRCDTIPVTQLRVLNEDYEIDDFERFPNKKNPNPINIGEKYIF